MKNMLHIWAMTCENISVDSVMWSSHRTELHNERKKCCVLDTSSRVQDQHSTTWLESSFGYVTSITLQLPRYGATAANNEYEKCVALLSMANRFHSACAYVAPYVITAWLQSYVFSVLPEELQNRPSWWYGSFLRELNNKVHLRHCMFNKDVEEQLEDSRTRQSVFVLVALVTL